MADGVRRRVGLIGFGEAGQAFARDLVERGAALAVSDPRFRGAGAPELRGHAEAIGVRVCGSVDQAVRGADIVVSAVTAAAALDVAREAAGSIADGQLFLDVNSVAPETRARQAELVEGAGGRYVEAAVMAAVSPHGIAVPMLLGGPWAGAAKALFEPFGADMQIASDEIGVASAIKLSRSIMVKGIEALAIEALLTARHYGAEAHVIESLNRTFPGVDWEERLTYLLGRAMVHGRRRAEEMREAAKTVRSAGLDPLMAVATAEREAWVAGLDVADAARGDPPPGLASLADAIRDGARR